MPMMALVNPVYDCLFRLAQPDSLSKEEEVGGPGTEGCGSGQSLAQLRMPALSMEAFQGIASWGRSLVGAFKACQLQDKWQGLEFIQNREQPKATGSEASVPAGKPTYERIHLCIQRV